jgi:5,10-methylenetetrahydromethanopterin reductase
LLCLVREMELWSLQTSSARSAPRRAQRLEAEGWDGMGVTDSQSLAGDPWVAITAAAAGTTTLRLGTTVTNPVTRHPAVTASAAASAAVVAGDRVVIGIGRGDSALAHLGRAPAPVSVLERYVKVLRTYLAGETVPFDDLDFHEKMAPPAATLGLADAPGGSCLTWLANAGVHVPVEVAASGPRVIATAACAADGVIFALGADAGRLRWGIQAARQARRHAGLDPDGLSFGAYINVVAHPEIEVARRLAVGALATVARFSVMHGEVNGPVTAEQREVLGDLQRGYDMNRHTRSSSQQAGVLTDAFIDGFAVVGPPSRVVERLQEIAELGVRKVIIVGVSPGSDRDNAATATAAMTEVLNAP